MSTETTQELKCSTCGRMVDTVRACYDDEGGMYCSTPCRSEKVHQCPSCEQWHSLDQMIEAFGVMVCNEFECFCRAADGDSKERFLDEAIEKGFLTKKDASYIQMRLSVN